MAISPRDAVIVDGLRTPVGKLRGALASVRPDDLGGHAIRSLLTRTGVGPSKDIDEVIFGCANQAGEDNRNVARMALLLAGLPDEVPGFTVNRLCASGLEAGHPTREEMMAQIGDPRFRAPYDFCFFMAGVLGLYLLREKVTGRPVLPAPREEWVRVPGLPPYAVDLGPEAYVEP